MKIIIKKSTLNNIILQFSILLFFSACSTESETVIIPKPLETTRLEMSEFVKSEISKVSICVVGYNKGDFINVDKFDAYKADYMAVLISAETALLNPNITFADIVYINSTLVEKGTSFNNYLWISDRRELNDSIIASTELNNKTMIGFAIGEVSEESKNVFTSAIASAQAVKNTNLSIDRQINEAIIKLFESKKIFLNAINK
jgi:hypothetical protein